MKVKTIPSAWMRHDGRRLDCGPYMSGALEAKIRLEELACRKERLADLTRGHNGGIFNGPQFSRGFVDNPEHGAPFLGSSSMLRADLSDLPLLRKRDAHSPKLAYLRVEPSMTLISCSGTIGRMVYARPDMDGMWSSQHILKVVPNSDVVPSGYLFAFLSSKFGVPLVTSGTYGAIIQHIEPQHIADLPVPRLGEDIEDRVGKLLDESAASVAKYQALVVKATRRLFEAVDLQDITAAQWHSDGPDLSFTASLPGVESFRALNFNPRFKELCDRIRQGPSKPLGDICIPGTLKRGGRFKRIDAEPTHAYKLVGQRHLFWLQPEGRWVARSALDESVLVEAGTVLIAARGTLGENELYCRAEFAWGPGIDLAYSEDILRAVADGEVMPRGCLFAFLRSESAFRMLRSISVGSKLQDHHYAFKDSLPVPYPAREVQLEVHQLVVDAYENRHRGVALEDEARALVERAIEEAS